MHVYICDKYTYIYIYIYIYTYLVQLSSLSHTHKRTLNNNHVLYKLMIFE